MRIKLTLWIAALLCQTVLGQATRPTTSPTSIAGAESFVYRNGTPQPMRLHVFKPDGWKPSDKRPALMFFFGGGWTHGSPAAYPARWSKLAASWGMVGIAPDYRTKDMFGTTPLDCACDGRAALRWVQEHAKELGIDPGRVVVGGISAGGQVALWTAITKEPQGCDAQESPLRKPAALVLFVAASDMTSAVGLERSPSPELALAASPIQHLDDKMPPTIMFHGDADQTVPYAQAVALDKRLKDSGNTSKLVTIPGGAHGYTSKFPEWENKGQDLVRVFLTEQGIIK